MLKSRWPRVFGEKRAVTTLEYALIGSMIALVIIVAVSQLGANLATTFGNFANNL